MDSPRDAVELWAVDVSAWNCAPYTQIDARGTKPAHAEALERDGHRGPRQPQAG